MKKLLFVASLLLVAFTSQAQLLKKSTVESIQSGKIVVALTEDEKVNEIWKAALNDRWSFADLIDFVNEEEAFDMLKADEVDYVLFLNTNVTSRSRSYDRGTYSYYYTSKGMAIEVRSGKRSNAAIQYIPPFGDDNEYAETFINFGVDALEYQFETILSKDLKSNMFLYGEYNENASMLKEKTLLILANWLHKKTTIEEAKELYEAPIEVVPFADWKEAILQKQEDKAYVVVVPAMANGKYVYLHYLMDSATGNVIGMGQPKVSVGIYGYSKGNSGFVNEKNLKLYNKLLD